MSVAVAPGRRRAKSVLSPSSVASRHPSAIPSAPVPGAMFGGASSIANRSCGVTGRRPPAARGGVGVVGRRAGAHDRAAVAEPVLGEQRLQRRRSLRSGRRRAHADGEDAIEARGVVGRAERDAHRHPDATAASKSTIHLSVSGTTIRPVAGSRVSHESCSDGSGPTTRSSGMAAPTARPTSCRLPSAALVALSNRPARITQAEIERAIRAAKKAGVAEVEVRIGNEARSVFHWCPRRPLRNPKTSSCNMDMPRPRPPHLQRHVTRHGRAVWYVRIGRGARIRIRASFGSPEFDTEYLGALQALQAGKPARQDRSTPIGSLAWLIERYRETGKWTGLSLATRRQRENIIKHVLELAGSQPVSRITKANIVAGRDRRAKDAPFQARHFLDTMRGLFRWAVEAGLVKIDPTAGVSDPTLPATEGFAVWTEDDVAAYQKRWPLGTRQRVWLDVLLYTGLRRGDAVRFGRQHIRDGVGNDQDGKDRHRSDVADLAGARLDVGRRTLRRPCFHRQRQWSALHQRIVRQRLCRSLPQGSHQQVSAWHPQARGDTRCECWSH